jgi:hypothetical protein
MKKLIIHTFIILTGCIFANGLVAQTDIKILDLAVLPKVEKIGESADSVELVIMFKINKSNKASKVNLWLGTAKDASDVLIAQPVFNTTGGNTFLVYDKISTEVKNYAATFYITLSKITYDSFSNATLFVETANGMKTTRLYYSK